jgi:hypothetical protein
MKLNSWRRYRVQGARRAVFVSAVLMFATVALALRADEVTKHFDIKAQPLAQALMAFGAQSGAIVMAPTELTSGKLSTPVSGQLTYSEALARMLRGTGLRFEMTAEGTVVIARESPPRT